MTMNRRLSGCLFLLTLLVAPPQAFGSDDGPSCAENSVVASAVQTREDVRAFVQCAYEYAIEMGPEEARRAFNEDERWNSGSIYVFISESTPESDQAHHFVFPPEPEREGTSRGLLIDVFGNDYYKEQHRITSGFGEGWLYYSFTNFATGRDEPKATYIKSIDWNGTPAGIGAGIYLRDIPGSCNREEVNAAGLACGSLPAESLQEFVRCARPWSWSRWGISPPSACHWTPVGDRTRSTCSAWTGMATRCSAGIPTAGAAGRWAERSTELTSLDRSGRPERGRRLR